MPNADKAEAIGKEAVAAGQADLAARTKELEELKAADPGIWEGLTETVTPQILQTITVIAKSQDVKLKSFRPQNPVADGDISRSNFVVIIEGSFPKVVAFSKAIDSASSNLGLSQVQIASVDQETDMVNATISVIAYIRQPEVKKGRTSEVATVKTPNEESTTKGAQIKKELANDPAKPTSIPKESK
jgi:Tfp pilus assembly protein PilO